MSQSEPETPESLRALAANLPTWHHDALTLLARADELERAKWDACENCRGTGYYGDNGPGIKGNREYVRCECGAIPKDERQRADELEREQRFFVDSRCGCIAVRDRQNTDTDYPGLHSDTEGAADELELLPEQPISNGDVCKCGRPRAYHGPYCVGLARGGMGSDCDCQAFTPEQPADATAGRAYFDPDCAEPRGTPWPFGCATVWRCGESVYKNETNTVSWRCMALNSVDIIKHRCGELLSALKKIFAVGDGYGPNPNRRGEECGTTGEGHATCREIARAALANARKEPS